MKYRVSYVERIPYEMEIEADNLDEVERKWRQNVSGHENPCQLREVEDETGRRWAATAYSRELIEIQ